MAVQVFEPQTFNFRFPEHLALCLADSVIKPSRAEFLGRTSGLSRNLYKSRLFGDEESETFEQTWYHPSAEDSLYTRSPENLLTNHNSNGSEHGAFLRLFEVGQDILSIGTKPDFLPEAFRRASFSTYPCMQERQWRTLQDHSLNGKHHRRSKYSP